ncbi:hypothetical protein ACWENQ_44375 [Nonomuraea sp. NPDC004354]
MDTPVPQAFDAVLCTPTATTDDTTRAFLYGGLSALIPTDEEGRRIVLAYQAHYVLTLTQPELAPEGLTYANALRDFVAERIRQAHEAGQVTAARIRTRRPPSSWR